MTPKQKAEELIAQYEKLMIGNYLTSHEDHKKMALIAVDEMYWVYTTLTKNIFKELKTEIENA